MSVVDKIISNIHDAIAEYKSKHGEDPEHLVLSMEQQQAIRLQVAWSQRVDPFKISDPVEFLGIPIIDKEKAVIP